MTRLELLEEQVAEVVELLYDCLEKNKVTPIYAVSAMQVILQNIKETEGIEIEVINKSRSGTLQ